MGFSLSLSPSQDSSLFYSLFFSLTYKYTDKILWSCSLPFSFFLFLSDVPHLCQCGCALHSGPHQQSIVQKTMSL